MWAPCLLLSQVPVPATLPSPPPELQYFGVCGPPPPILSQWIRIVADLDPAYYNIKKCEPNKFVYTCHVLFLKVCLPSFLFLFLKGDSLYRRHRQTLVVMLKLLVVMGLNWIAEAGLLKLSNGFALFYTSIWCCSNQML